MDKLSDLLENANVEDMFVQESSPLSKRMTYELNNLKNVENQYEIMKTLTVVNDFLKKRTTPNTVKREVSFAIKDLFGVSKLETPNKNTMLYKTLEENKDLSAALFSNVIENSLYETKNGVEIDLDLVSLFYLKNVQEGKNAVSDIIVCPILLDVLNKSKMFRPKKIDGFDYNIKSLNHQLLMKNKIDSHLSNLIDDNEAYEIEQAVEYFLEKNNITRAVMDDFENEHIFVQGQKIEPAFLGTTKDGQLSPEQELDESTLSNEEKEKLKESKELYKKLFEDYLDDHNLQVYGPKDKMDYDAFSTARNIFTDSSATTSIVSKTGDHITEVVRYSPIADVLSFPTTKSHDKELIQQRSLEAGILYAKKNGWKTIKLSHAGKPEEAVDYIKRMLKTIENQKPQLYKLEDVKVQDEYKYLLTEKLNIANKQKVRMKKSQ